MGPAIFNPQIIFEFILINILLNIDNPDPDSYTSSKDRVWEKT